MSDTHSHSTDTPSSSSRALSIEYCPICTLPPEYCSYGPTYDRCKVYIAEHYPEYLVNEPAATSSSASTTTAVNRSNAAVGSSSAATIEEGMEQLNMNNDEDDSKRSGSKKKSKEKKKKSSSKKVKVKKRGGDAWSDEDDDDVEQEEEDVDESASSDSDAEEEDEHKSTKHRIKQTAAINTIKSATSADTAAATSTAKSKQPPNILISKQQRSKNKYITTIRGLDLYPHIVSLKDAAKAMSKKFACSASVVKVTPGQSSSSSGMEIAIQGDVQQDIPDFLIEKYGDIPESNIYIVQDNGKRVKAFD